MLTIRLKTSLAAAALVLAACNGDDDGIGVDADPGDIDGDVEIDAEPEADADTDDLDADTDLDAAAAVTEVNCDDVTPDVEIAMENNEFVDPDNGTETTVAPGEAVRWTNNDAVAHTVTSGSPDDPEAEQGELFDSGNLEQDETYCLQFEEEGDYEYFCRTHPDEMQATITVQ